MNKRQIVNIIVLMLIISIAPISVAANNDFENTHTKISEHHMLIRLFTTHRNSDIFRELEIVSMTPDQWTDVIIDVTSLANIIKLGVPYEIKIPNVESYLESIRGTYHTLAQMESILQDIATNYPTITDLYSIGTTYEGRDIWCLEITDNPGTNEGEPGVFFMGLHHAREWPTVEICLHIADELTSNYGSDPTITDIVENTRIWLVTCVNPDGYYYCHDQGHDWRKNRRYFSEFGTYGVDLNRNYAGSSNGDKDGIWGSVGDASATHHPDEEVYCGPNPFSELETQAVRDIFLQNEISAAISWHTYGQLVMWPWAYDFPTAPDNTYLSSVGTQIAQAITQQSGSGTYTPQQGAYLYPTTGDTTDWVYGFHHYVLGRACFAYTIEACSTFHPSASYLDQIVAENFDGAMVLLQEAENIRDTVAPRVLPPEIDMMTTDPDGNYSISWSVQNPDANPTKFQLDELSALTLEQDDAESSPSLWINEGFTSSTQRAHSGSKSYKAHSSNKKTTAMTYAEPLPVSDGMLLSFWTWYDIESNWDYAFVEVSTNGRTYDILDAFTGSSGGWQEKQYDLSTYAGESVCVRFRYTTDAGTLEEGFYIDDITPIPAYGTIQTLSDDIQTQSYDVVGRPEGTYYYRVKGYNADREWGDFSLLEDIEVISSNNQAPNTPTILGNAKGKAGQTYSYVFSTSDPNNDSIWYYVDWGDGSNSGWIGPQNSSESISLNHTWNEKGTYEIRCKAKDSFDAESAWATLAVQMPQQYLSIHNIIQWLVQRITWIIGLF